VTAAFDTLKFVDKLEAGGFSSTQARAAAEAFADATSEQLATKADIAKLGADIRELRADVKADLAETKSEILKWMFGQTLLIIGVLMALLRFGH